MAAMKLIVMWSCALASNSQKFLPIHQDPADALANKLLTSVGFDQGFDSDEKKVPAAVKNYVKGSNTVPSFDGSNTDADSSVSGKPHSRLSSGDLLPLKPEIATETLTTPQAWAAGSSQDSDDESLSSLRNGMKHLYQDLASTPVRQDSTSTADWSQFRRDRFSEPKEIVKVDERDAVVHQPVQQAAPQVSTSARDAMNHQLAQQSAPQVSTSDDKSSEPEYVNKLRLPASLTGASAGLRWFKKPLQAHAQVQDKSSTKTQVTNFMNATELENKVTEMTEEAEGTDSLAKSLSSHFKIEKKKEISRMQRRDLPTGDEVHTHRNSTNSTQNAEPETSAMDSLHRGLRGSQKMLKIRPEDIREAQNETEEMPEAEEMPDHFMSRPAPRKVRAKRPTSGPTKEHQTHVAKQDPMQSLFKSHAVEGFVDADGMEAVLNELGTKKNWNWRLFDIDGDSKLSYKEFASAVIVAQRFKGGK